MKDQILKIAKVKSEKEFYKKFPTEEAFMAKHGKQLQKAAMGKAMVNKQLHQLTEWDNVPIGQYGITTPPIFEFTKPESFGAGAEAAGLAGLQNIGQIISGVQAIGEQKKTQKKQEQSTQLSGLALQANQTMQPSKRKYVRPEDALIQPGQIGNPYGSGTNYLAQNGRVIRDVIGGNLTEIQNTYAPNDIYTDLGFEPMSETLKQYKHGGGLPHAEFGDYFQNSGQAQIGSAVGSAIGSAFGPAGAAVGKLVGSIGGNLLGGAKQARELREEKEKTALNQQQLAFQQGMQNQFGAYLEDGGKVGNEYKWVSHTWQPQVIAKFGEYNVKDLLKPPHDADMLRSGGHLKEDYVQPSAAALFTGRPDMPHQMDNGGRMRSTNMMFDTDKYPRAEFGNDSDMNGDLEVIEGGKAETISYNPFLPDGGETVMFRGRSHDKGGIPINFGENGVEVEGGEPAVKLQDGGQQSNMVVFGNMKINKRTAKLMGDPKAKGKKFKTYVADIAKNDKKQLGRINKALDIIENADENSAYDHLALNTGNTILEGAKAWQKINANKIKEAGIVQNAILDTASKLGVKSDKLAEGKIEKETDPRMMAKYGKNILKAQGGRFIPSDYDITDQFNIENPKTLPEISLTAPKKKSSLSFDTPGRKNVFDINIPDFQEAPSYEDVITNLPKDEKGKINWMGLGQMALSNVAPFLRPSDANEGLPPDQLYPEYFALATNQQVPVQAQLFQPMLDTPYDISYNDQLNAIDASGNAAIRAAGPDAAAQATIMAQILDAKNKIKGEETRVNQANKMETYARNRAMINAANEMNLKIIDNQYVRQAQAASNTREQALEALKSISAKTAQQRATNRKLAVLENMYGFRFSPSGRAINYNFPAQFNLSGDPFTRSASQRGLAPGYGYTYDEQGQIIGTRKLSKSEQSSDNIDDLLSEKNGGKTSKKSARNSSIVKALKNL